MKADDYTLGEFDRKQISKYADLLLRKADAYGRFPTPIADIVAAAELEVSTELIFDEQGLGDLYRSLPNEQKLRTEVLKQAVGKVEGILHREEQTIFLAPGLHKSRQKFITLHEVGHQDLPWQRKTYKFLEDSKSELDECTLDEFERQANCFASDVWFQLDRFTSDARDCDFGIGSPIKILTKSYGTSCYATLRRYVQVCGRASVLVVCDKVEGSLSVRRVIESPEFLRDHGSMPLPEMFYPSHFFYQTAPLKKFRSPTPWTFDAPGRPSLACLVEGYDSTRNVFFLIYPTPRILFNLQSVQAATFLSR